jgi:DNA-directed RNA polymerase specialized sigma24 family protein
LPILAGQAIRIVARAIIPVSYNCAALPPNSDWALTSGAFDRLLAILDEDRDAAAVAYGQLRQRVVGLHRWWGAVDPDGLADLTLDRAARKLDEGAPVQRGDFSAYVRGVARMVFFEAARQPRPVGLDREPLEESAEAEHAPLDCLDECLGTLDARERRLVLRYYDGRDQIAERRRLASEMGISPTALRLRTHRLRTRLEECVSSCLKRK